MQLTKDLRERLGSEFRLAVSLMVASESPREKLYYFSVLYLESGRIINWQWDSDLVLIWLVTQQTHQRATAKLLAMLQGDQVAPLPDDYFVQLTQATYKLTEYIEKDGSEQELTQIMGTFAQLNYLTTGNGYYLTQKQSIIKSLSST